MSVEPPGLSRPLPLDFTLPSRFAADCGSLFRLLGPFLSSARQKRFLEVSQQRSRQVLPVFEDTHHAHNISAVLRSTEAFGFLDVCFVYGDPTMKFRLADTIDRGASQWLLPRRLKGVPACIELLKQSGYAIVLVSLPDFSRTADYYHKGVAALSCEELSARTLDEHSGGRPIALVFGSELHGISQAWHQVADLYLFVGMRGFTESLNVSVCAGILLQALRQHLAHRPVVSELENRLILEYWTSMNCSFGGRYIASHHPQLLPWYEFVVSRSFLQEYP